MSNHFCKSHYWTDFGKLLPASRLYYLLYFLLYSLLYFLLYFLCTFFTTLFYTFYALSLSLPRLFTGRRKIPQEWGLAVGGTLGEDSGDFGFGEEEAGADGEGGDGSTCRDLLHHSDFSPSDFVVTLAARRSPL